MHNSYYSRKCVFVNYFFRNNLDLDLFSATECTAPISAPLPRPFQTGKKRYPSYRQGSSQISLPSPACLQNFRPVKQLHIFRKSIPCFFIRCKGKFHIGIPVRFLCFHYRHTVISPGNDFSADFTAVRPLRRHTDIALCLR